LDETIALKPTITPANATSQILNWSSSDMAVATVSSTGVVTAVSNGTSIITASAIDGSNQFATCLITVSTVPNAIQSISEKETLRIYPNPATELLTLELKGFSSNNPIAVNIFSINGQLVYSKVSMGDTTMSLPIEKLFKSGIYFIRVQNNSNVTTHKLIINDN
jgi:hypothetical protein